MEILDGYNQTYEDGGTVVEFRPMLRPERAQVALLDDDRLKEQLVGHVVWTNGGKITEACAAAIIGDDQQEIDDCDNLYHGTILGFRYPRMVSCETCQKWSVNPLTGVFQMRGDKQVPRQSPEDLLCRTREGCPKGTPENPRGLSPKNRRALEHDLECRAVGTWPDDPIVRRNARIIGLAIREVSRGR